MLRPAALALLMLAGSSLVAQTSAARDVDLPKTLDAYLAGQHDEAVEAIATLPDLGPFRLRFVQDTPAWVHAAPPESPRRLAAAAAFLLELTHARLESDWGRLSDLVEWMCLQLRAQGAATPFERAWHQATVALAGRARARTWLLGELPRLPHQPPLTRRPTKNPNPSPMHLMHALDRLPDDPQLRLAQIIAWTWGRDQEPTRNAAAFDVGGRRSLRRPPQLEALVALAPLVDDPVVGAEALLRIGLVHFSVADYPAALDAFGQAQARTTNATIRYLALFSAGRTLEAQQRLDEALRSYLQALELIPGAESATIAAASLQFVTDDRDSALRLLETAFGGGAIHADPGRLLGYGSFVHWPQRLAALRAELAR